jgi:hypothetical protein
MAPAIYEEIRLNEEVSEFLVHHGAQKACRVVCELAQSCFPSSLGLEIFLQEDPDEVERGQAIVRVLLPEDYSDDELHANLRRYHDGVVKQIPLAQCPLFALVTEFRSE